MTLCIAAACQDNSRPRIVFCSDTKIGRGGASAEVGDKVSFLLDRWPALMAGTVSRAEELLSIYASYMRRRRLTELNVLDEFKRPAQIQKNKVIDEYIWGKLGISYNQLLRRGKQEVPRKRRETIFDEIDDLSLDCDLIFGGFVDDEAYLFRVDGDDASATYDEDFQVIGSGARFANASLVHREHHSERDLDSTVYHVYEAKKLGEVNPDVGADTYVDILRPGRSGRVLVQTMTEAGLKFLDTQFKKFGPQPTKDKIKVNRKFFEAL